VIDGRELGRGYGHATPRSDAAMTALSEPGPRGIPTASPAERGAFPVGSSAGPRLDGVYSAKAAAALLRLHRAGAGPLVFWASKSTATLAPPSRDALDRAPPALARWLRRHDH
jgi:hypothetical protein